MSNVMDMVMAIRQGKVYDDHNSGRSTRSIDAIVAIGEYVTIGGEKVIVAVYDQVACINQVYLDDDGAFHLSMRSVGGVHCNLQDAKEMGVINMKSVDPNFAIYDEGERLVIEDNTEARRLGVY